MATINFIGAPGPDWEIKEINSNQEDAPAPKAGQVICQPVVRGKMNFDKSWAITRKHLEKARQLLPVIIKQDDRVESITSYQEFLQHNELECALDQLEGLGEVNSCPQEFWHELSQAAESMGLADRARQMLEIKKCTEEPDAQPRR